MNQKRNLKEILFRLLFFSVGVAIIAAGGSLYFLSDMGADPFNVFAQGIARVFGISNGLSVMGINLLYLCVILIFARGYVRIGTFAAIFICGPMIDVFSPLFSLFINESSPLWARVLFMIAGTVVLSFGLALVISADAGVAPNDLASVIISDKTHIAFRWVRIAVDTTLTVLGFFLGGTVGAGTVAGAFLTGPLAQLFIPIHRKLVSGLLNKTVHKAS